jgi:hypothetical protein
LNEPNPSGDDVKTRIASQRAKRRNDVEAKNMWVVFSGATNSLRIFIASAQSVGGAAYLQRCAG